MRFLSFTPIVHQPFLFAVNTSYLLAVWPPLRLGMPNAFLFLPTHPTKNPYPFGSVVSFSLSS